MQSTVQAQGLQTRNTCFTACKHLVFRKDVHIHIMNRASCKDVLVETRYAIGGMDFGGVKRGNSKVQYLRSFQEM